MSKRTGARIPWPAAVIALFVAAAATEAQTLYSAGTPTNEQQYVLELTNRARVNGVAEAARLGFSSLQEGPPTINREVWNIFNSVQPLARNQKLANAAQAQADVLDNGDAFFPGMSPAPYTAVVRGLNNTSGIGLVKVYGLS